MQYAIQLTMPSNKYINILYESFITKPLFFFFMKGSQQRIEGNERFQHPFLGHPLISVNAALGTDWKTRCLTIVLWGRGVTHTMNSPMETGVAVHAKGKVLRMQLLSRMWCRLAHGLVCSKGDKLMTPTMEVMANKKENSKQHCQNWWQQQMLDAKHAGSKPECKTC